MQKQLLKNILYLYEEHNKLTENYIFAKKLMERLQILMQNKYSQTKFLDYSSQAPKWLDT